MSDRKISTYNQASLVTGILGLHFGRRHLVFLAGVTIFGLLEVALNTGSSTRSDKLPSVMSLESASVGV